MTVLQFRNMLAEEMNKAFDNKERLKAFEIAYDLSEKLYDTYDVNPSNVKKPYMTNRQLAEILAKSYGQVKLLPYEKDKENYFSFETVWVYFGEENGGDDGQVPDNVVIRRWGTDNWIEPTVEVYEEFTQSLPYPFYTEDTSSNSKKKVIY